MTARRRVRVALLLIVSLTAATFAAQILGLNSPALPGTQPVYASGAPPVLGIDCGLGSTAGAIGSPPGPPVIGDGALDTSCSWIGDVDASPGGTLDGIVDPLVSDAPSSFPGVGGGFSAEVRAIGLPTNVNGYDIVLRWNPRYLYGVKIDFSGTVFGDPAFNPFPITTTIDNSLGEARVAVVLLMGTTSGDQTLFRLRFDVVGVGTSNLTLLNDVITNPGAVAHKTQNARFESASFYDPSALGFDVYWAFSPDPEVPGSPLTFTAVAVCAGCGALTYNWDFDSSGTTDATGSTVAVTAPPPTVHRVRLTVTDGANLAEAVRLLPLAVSVLGPSTLTAGAAASTYTGRWLGGIPNYSGSWRFCPTTTPAALICSNAAPNVLAGPGQTNAPTVQYKYGGVYTDTLRIQESTPLWISSTPNAVTTTFLVTVTPAAGFPAAYIVTVTNPASASPGDTVTIVATMQYAGDSAVVLDLNNNGVFDSGETLVGGALPPAGTALLGDALIKYRDANNNLVRDGTECVFYDNNNNGAVDLDENIGGTCPGVGGTIRNQDARIKFVDENNSGVYEFRSYPGGARASFFDVFFEFGDATSATVLNQGLANCALSPTLLCQVSTTHVYNMAGTFTIRATATENAAVAVSKIKEVGTSSIIISTAQPLCAAAAGGCDFTVSPASPTAGAVATFTVTVNGGTSPYMCAWNFGDGSTASPAPCSTGTTFTHTYATKGSKTVVLTVTDSASGSSTVTHAVVVQPVALAADFTFSPASPTVGKAVTFTATVTGGTTPYVFSWNFGDGTPAGTTNPVSHTYATKGSRSVVLTVTDANSVVRTVTKTVVVVGQPIVADFTFSPVSPTAGKAVTFTATVSGGTSPYTFSWNFGDGTPVQTGNPTSHTFATKGTRSVVLTVTDANSVVRTVTKTVVVVGQPIVVDFTFSPAAPRAAEPVTFTATISGGTTPYMSSWNFGDGTPAGSGNPVTHTYAAAGTFTVTLTVTDANGASASNSHAVTVSPQALPLTADFNVSPSIVFVTEPVMFTAVVSGGVTPYTYSWDALADGTVDGTASTLAFAFPSKGPRDVTLTVTDQAGTSVTVLKTFLVRLEPKFAALKWDDGQKAFFTKFKVLANFEPPLTTNIHIRIDIFDATTGAMVAVLDADFPNIPQRTATIVFIPWSGYTPGVAYNFVGTLTYQTLDATGTDGQRTGSFVPT